MFWPPEKPLDLHQRLKETGARDFAEELYSEQLDLQTSLTLTCAKLYNKEVLTLVDFPEHVEKIKARAMDKTRPAPDMDQIYARRYDLGGESIETMVEKMAILTHIKDREF